jgi:hypothetical protein
MNRKKSSEAERREQATYDEALEESFPASDSPAAGGVTRIERPPEGEGNPREQVRRNVPHATSDDMDEPTGRDDGDA